VATEKRVLVPDIGEFSGVEVVEVLVKPGDRIEAEDSLITLESDKATMEIPSPHGGVVKSVSIKVGDRVSEGDELIILELEATDSNEASTEAAASEPPPSLEETPAEAVTQVQPGAAAAGHEQLVRVPDIGEFSGVEVIEVLVKPGDRIAAEDSLITLESDKATMEIPSPLGGVVKSVAISVGDRVSEGDDLITLEVDAAAVEQPAPQQPAPATDEAEEMPQVAQRLPGEKERQAPPVLVRPSDAPPIRAHASPSVRRFARELGADLTRIRGSGPKGRVLKEDVQNYIKQVLSGSAPATVSATVAGLPRLPEVDFSKFGEVEEKPLGRIKKISSAHLSACWLNIPHVTQFDEADITELEAFRKAEKESAAREGVKLTFLPFLMKACVAALREMPEFNSSLGAGGETLIYKRYFHIGVAVDTPNGLMVPVVRDVDKKGIYALARELAELSGKAREGKLGPAEMQGGCFSISSLGGIGGTAFTPIVNAPEVAILGVSRSSMKPVWDEYHRAVDSGAVPAEIVRRVGFRSIGLRNTRRIQQAVEQRNY